MMFDTQQKALSRFVRVTLGTTALGLILSATGISFGGHGQFHNSESAPHRCAGCVDGTCTPRSVSYGHYQSHWRRWPGATTYEGYKKRKPSASVPAPKIPEPVDEVRIESRTRSDRPLDPEPENFSGGAVNMGGDRGGAGLPDAIVPGAGSDADPNNPFNQAVPNSDLPAPGGAPAGADADAGIFGGGFGEPDSPTGTDGNMFDAPAPTDTTPEFDTDSLFPSTLVPTGNALANTGPVRSIKNRRLDMQTNPLPESGPVVPRVNVPTPDVPQIDTVGGNFISDGFATNDLLPPPKEEETPPKYTGPTIDIDQVSFDSPVEETGFIGTSMKGSPPPVPALLQPHSPRPRSSHLRQPQPRVLTSQPASRSAAAVAESAIAQAATVQTGIREQLQDVASNPNLLASATTLMPTPKPRVARQHVMPKHVQQKHVQPSESKAPAPPALKNHVVETASRQAKVAVSTPTAVVSQLAMDAKKTSKQDELKDDLQHDVVAKPAAAAKEVVVEEVLEEVVIPTGNPLRARRRVIKTTIKKSANQPVSKTNKPADTTLKSLSSTKVKNDVTQARAAIMAPQRVASKPVAKTKLTPVSAKATATRSNSNAEPKTVAKRLDSTRTLSSLNHRSLRDTLRKNPLR